MDTASVIGLLLLPAAILWAIPKTRRAGGNTATAWKSVPFGCATMLLIPELIGGLIWLLAESGWAVRHLPGSPVFFLALLFLSVTAGILVILKIRNCCWKHFPTEEHVSSLPFYAAFSVLAVFGCGAMIALQIISYGIMIKSGRQFHGPWRTYKIVHEYGTELAFQERSIHPFLAEYDYRFRFRKDGAETFQDLWVNTGGRTFFNVFRLKNGRLFFSDKRNDYIVDVKTRKVWLILKEGRDYYAAALPSEGFDSPSYGFGKVSGKFQIRIGQRPVETVSVTDQLGGMTYIGCITTGFFPASEKPYQQVTKMYQ
ncbi:MAG: hypothetical protein IKO93_14925 [Lentisphaeria bacterium]|nr:hypothetical protein [Lentisphaeria bacterium]